MQEADWCHLEELERIHKKDWLEKQHWLPKERMMVCVDEERMMVRVEEERWLIKEMRLVEQVRIKEGINREKNGIGGCKEDGRRANCRRNEDCNQKSHGRACNEGISSADGGRLCARTEEEAQLFKLGEKISGPPWKKRLLVL